MEVITSVVSLVNKGILNKLCNFGILSETLIWIFLNDAAWETEKFFFFFSLIIRRFVMFCWLKKDRMCNPFIDDAFLMGMTVGQSRSSYN